MGSLVGQAAPAVSVSGQDGRPHSIEEHRGRPVILFFFPKADTPG
jgi:peroxiredoxin